MLSSIWEWPNSIRRIMFHIRGRVKQIAHHAVPVFLSWSHWTRRLAFRLSSLLISPDGKQSNIQRILSKMPFGTSFFFFFNKNEYFHTKTNRLELPVGVQTCLSLCCEVAEHLEWVSMATLVWIYPVITWKERGNRESGAAANAKMARVAEFYM